MPETTIAIVLASGVGTRVGAETPKQFLELNGITVLVRTVTSIAWCDRVVVCITRTFGPLTQTCWNSRLASRVELVPAERPGVSPSRRPGSARGRRRRRRTRAPKCSQHPHTPRRLVEACLDGLSTPDVVVAYVPAVHTIFSHDGRELLRSSRAAAWSHRRPDCLRLGCLRRIVAAQAKVSAQAR